MHPSEPTSRPHANVMPRRCTGTAGVQAACTYSKRALGSTPEGSREKDDRPRRLMRLSATSTPRQRLESILTVVALLTLSAVTRHMAVAAARVAGLASATTESRSTAGVVAATVAASETATLGAVASNVTVLATLVAFLVGGTASTGTASTTAVRGGLAGAVAGDVASLAATVAGALRLRWALLSRLLALAAQMALATTVVACRVALGGAITSLVSGVAACKS